VGGWWLVCGRMDLCACASAFEKMLLPSSHLETFIHHLVNPCTFIDDRVSYLYLTLTFRNMLLLPPSHWKTFIHHIFLFCLKLILDLHVTYMSLKF